MTKEELKNILELHKLYVQDKDGGVRADLSGADLRYADLNYADLRSADLNGVNLRYANLRNANLRYANLRYANLSGADLWYANLSDANLSDANLSYAKMNLTYLSISGIGTAQRMTTYCLEENKIWCGCFVGTMEEFKQRVEQEYANEHTEKYYKQYMIAIDYFKAQAILRVGNETN